MNEVETRFKYVLALFHQTLCDIIKVLILKHPYHISYSMNYNEDLSEIFQAIINIKSIIPSITYPENYRKIFQNNTIRPTIDIDNLDITILVDIALKLEGFLTNRSIEKLKEVPCTSASHGKLKCCNNVCHDYQICGQIHCKKCCTSPNSKCNHTCIHCPKNDKECQHDSVVCCKQCQICIYCMSTQPKCIYLKLRESLKGFEVLRYISVHATIEEYQEYCTDWFDIWNILDEHLQSCLEYLEKEKFIPSDIKCERSIDMRIVRNGSINQLRNYFSHVILPQDSAKNEDIKLLAETIRSAQAGELSLLFMPFITAFQ